MKTLSIFYYFNLLVAATAVLGNDILYYVLKSREHAQVNLLFGWFSIENIQDYRNRHERRTYTFANRA